MFSVFYFSFSLSLYLSLLFPLCVYFDIQHTEKGSKSHSFVRIGKNLLTILRHLLGPASSFDSFAGPHLVLYPANAFSTGLPFDYVYRVPTC